MRNNINICWLEFDQCGKQGQLLLLSLHKHIFVAKSAQGADNTMCSWKGRSMSGSLSLGEHTTFCAWYFTCVFSCFLVMFIEFYKMSTEYNAVTPYEWKISKILLCSLTWVLYICMANNDDGLLITMHEFMIRYLTRTNSASQIKSIVLHIWHWNVILHGTPWKEGWHFISNPPDTKDYLFWWQLYHQL